MFWITIVNVISTNKGNSTRDTVTCEKLCRLRLKVGNVSGHRFGGSRTVILISSVSFGEAVGK